MKHLCSPHHLLCQLLVFCGLGNLLLIHKKTNPIGHYRLKIFGFLQIHQEFNSTKNSNPPRIQMTIRKSKTDQIGKTITLVINSAKAQLICPVRVMQYYLLMRPTNLCDQLFIPYDETRLSRYRFSSLLKKTLTFCEVKSGCYKSHSFRQ
jgi:hypothetical protein